MARDFQDFVNEVSARASIVRIASDYTRLKKQGSRYTGLCPFHEEKTPSFTISAEKNLYHCFGCGVGGNIFGFIMALEGIGFQEAVKIVAQRSGIPIPSFKSSERREAGIEQKLFDLNESVATWFFQNLSKYEDAYSYLKKRAVEEDTVKKYRLGYAPDTWDSLLKYLRGKGLDDETLRKSGLFAAGKTNELYDMFRGRIIFPIQDYEGRIVGFGGRTMKDDAVKYLNSPETPVFHKSRSLFGLYLSHKPMREKNCAILVEGYFDQLMMWQAGFKNTVAPLGTSFNRQGASVLKRYTSDVIIAFDSDEAGMNAGLRTLTPLLSNGFNVRFLKIEEGKDPDEFIRKNGAKAMEKLIEQAAGMFDHLVTFFLKDADKNNPRTLIKALDNILEHLQNISDPAEKEIYQRRLAEKFNLSEDVIIKKSSRRYEFKREPEKLQKSRELDVPLDEKRLIRILMDCSSPPLKDIRELLTLGAVSNRCAAILKVITDETDKDKLAALSLIMDKLDEELKSLFSVLMIEDACYKEAPEKELEECIKSIKKRFLFKLRDEEKNRLKEAAGSGQESKVEEILKKIQDLACQIEKLS
jgi:DNA primase